MNIKKLGLTASKHPRTKIFKVLETIPRCKKEIGGSMAVIKKVKKEGKKTSSKIKKSDVVHVDFETWIVESNEIYATSKEELAKEHDIYDEKIVYEPKAVIVGVGRELKGIDDSFLKASVGEENEIEIPPSEGAGVRDPKLVELHSIRGFLRRDIEPKVGLEVTLKNKTGLITAVTAGRVRVDFNHPLAGKTLRYKYKVVDKAETIEDKLRGILEVDYGTSDDFVISVKGEKATIKLPETCKTDLVWFTAKYKVISDFRELANLKKIDFVEEYIKKEVKDEEKKEGKKAEEKEEVEKNKEPKEELKDDKSTKK